MPVAGARPEPSRLSPSGRPPVVHLRFVGGGSARRVSGTITIGDAKAKPRSFDVQPVELGRDAFKADGEKLDVSFRTSASVPVGFDVVVDPPGTPVGWELWLDDEPWPEDGVFGGPYGLPAPLLWRGIASDDARASAEATALPSIDTRHDVGLFVVRERPREGEGAARR